VTSVSTLVKPSFEESLLAALAVQAQMLAAIHADLVGINQNLTCLKEAFAASAEGG
jgi:hypothetical protein